MATTERRKSISLFFGFSKQEPKIDAVPDNFPKLRRKLQKVTKLSDTDMNTTTVNSTITAAPAPDVGGVQTVKLPGDETFLATKYDASRPPPSRGNSSRPALAAVAKPAPAKEEKQVRRESRARSFFRSASTSRVPNYTRSSSSTRAATATPTTATGSAIRPDSSRGEPAKPAVATAVTSTIPIAPTKTTTTERPSTATSTSSGRNNFMLHGNTSRQSSYGTVVIDAESRAAAELQALGDAQDAAQAQKKAAQAAAQARAFQMMEEHERISAHERSSHGHGHTQKSTPPSASRTKRMTMLPLTLGAQSTEKPAARPYPMFHRPYSHSQHQNIITPVEADVRRTLSTATKQQSQSPYTSRKSMHSAGLAPVTVPSMPMSTSPVSPIMSSAMSDSSSTSMSSPTSAAFNLSSASLALTAATSVTQSYNNLPLSANGSASSCAGSSPDGSVVGSFPYTLSRRRNRSKYDFDNESSDSGSGSGSDGRRVVPELSYLSGDSSRGSPPTPDSPSSISSAEATTGATKPRRKVKTPVYTIGQLEGAHETTTTAAVATEKVELSLLQSKSSIECIAEEYRALLASRNSQSTADGKSEVNVDAIQRPVSGGTRSRNSLRRSVGANNLQANAAAIGSQRKFMLASPGRDDSPLLPAAVFKELIPRDIINSPAPPPPLPPLRTRSSMMDINPINNSNSFHDTANTNSIIYEKPKMQTPPPPPQPVQPAQTDNLSLQICVDLLTRELSSAVLHRSSPAAATAASQRAATRRQLQQNGTGSVYNPTNTSSLAPTAPAADNTSSALQILVMIEAYERLRDQLLADAQKKSGSERNSQNNGETKEIEAMFGLWLKSLYRIHDSLTNEEKNDDDDYDDDNDELDNTSDSEYDYDSAAESV